jgi:hypothetical protein
VRSDGQRAGTGKLLIERGLRQMIDRRDVKKRRSRQVFLTGGRSPDAGAQSREETPACAAHERFGSGALAFRAQRATRRSQEAPGRRWRTDSGRCPSSITGANLIRGQRVALIASRAFSIGAQLARDPAHAASG